MFLDLRMCWYMVRRDDMLYVLLLFRKFWIVFVIFLNVIENNDLFFFFLKVLCLIFDLLVYDEK